MKFKLCIRHPFILFLTLLSFQSIAFAQSDSAALANADTSRFSVNASGGWLLYNSYVSENGVDSVLLEIVIRHDNNINWGDEHYVGKIKYGPLKPTTEQKMTFSLINDLYTLRIDTAGKCYFRLVTGTTPTANPVTIPVMVNYKK